MAEPHPLSERPTPILVAEDHDLLPPAMDALLKLAGLLVLGVGLSRIFVGVQYPSDVLGGYVACMVWMAVCITGVHIARHRQMDREHPGSIVAAEQIQPTLP